VLRPGNSLDREGPREKTGVSKVSGRQTGKHLHKYCNCLLSDHEVGRTRKNLASYVHYCFIFLADVSVGFRPWSQLNLSRIHVNRHGNVGLPTYLIVKIRTQIDLIADAPASASMQKNFHVILSLHFPSKSLSIFPAQDAP
jgi:hypothetical protein